MPNVATTASLLTRLPPQPSHRSLPRTRTILLPNLPRYPVADPTNLIHIHPSIRPERMDHVHQVLGRDIARRAGTVRTPAQPADGTIERPDPVLQRDQRVHERLPEGIVEVHGEVLVQDPGFAQRLQQFPRPRRTPHPRRVRHADLVRAHLEQLHRQVGDAVGVRVRAFEGTPQRDRDVRSHGIPGFPALGHQGGEALQALVDRAVGVPLAEGFRRGHEDGDFVFLRVGCWGRPAAAPGSRHSVCSRWGRRHGVGI